MVTICGAALRKEDIRAAWRGLSLRCARGENYWMPMRSLDELVEWEIMTETELAGVRGDALRALVCDRKWTLPGEQYWLELKVEK